MKAERIAIHIVLICIVAITWIGAIVFSEGYESEDPYRMCGGLGLMLIFWTILLMIAQKSKNQSLEEEIEELKTDLALLQNRCDWLEDDICKEYRKETYPHNIEEDLP